jgi:hypothetical protein
VIPTDLADPDRVVVLRALGLGDALTGVPALRGLRRRYPHAVLTLLAPAGIGGWLRDLGVLDAVVDVGGLDAPWSPDDVKGGAGCVAVNLHGRGPQSHQLLQVLRPERLVAFAGPGHPDGPAWDAGEHEVDRWCRLAEADSGWCDRDDLLLNRRDVLRLGGRTGAETWRPGMHVVVHPGAASGSRRWPVERWAAVVRTLVESGEQVVLTGSAGEQEICRRIVDLAAVPEPDGSRIVDLSGRSSLAELAAVIASTRLLICGDTGVAHLATATSARSVLLFGPVSPRLWGPARQPERHWVIWHGEEARPGDPHGKDPDPALLAITPAEVLTAATAQLASPSTAGAADPGRRRR